ncbi:MAG: Small-conductance mechanosensitive channel [Gammaproteobacteria bacterium]|nr:Small-conductance mechanosensitive channel [Gammaproteobacteria bacterium]
MPSLGGFWQVEFLGNDLRAWTLALATFLITLTVLPIVKRYISARRRRWAEHDRQNVHHAIGLTALLIERTNRLVLWAVAVYLASRYLTFTPRIERVLTVGTVALFWTQVGLWAMTAVRYAIDLRRKTSAGLDALLASSIDVILFAAGLVIWAMVLLLALDNLGVEIKPLLAGLGIGGIAVALAVQTVLSDLLASMSIALDKPFAIGDFLTVDDFQGTVEHIGVKSTRLRSLSGEQIIMGNTDILKSRVRNFGRMRERRAAFKLGVSYDTDPKSLAAIPGVIRQIIETTPETRFDRCHFLTYGDTALQFEVVFFTTKPDFGAYADAQQQINLRIMERFQEMKVSFAAPTRAVVYIENPASASASASASATQGRAK